MSARTPPTPPWVRMQDVEVEPVDWLWRARIPYGKLAFLEGNPDEGKTTLALEIAARLTTGTPLPDSDTPNTPAGVVILTAEDGLGDTIRPRLEAAGADLSRMVAFKLDRLPTISSTGNLGELEHAIAEVQAKLVVTDPMTAFLGDKVDSWKDHAVRRALGPLTALAVRTGAAILLVRHLTKSGGTEAKYRGGGSVGFGAAARAVMLVGPDPDDENRKILARVKGNLAAPYPALAYVLEAAGSTTRIRWLGITDHRAADLLGEPEDPEEKGRVAEAMDFLREALAGSPRTPAVVQKEARARDISRRTLDRAKRRLRVKSRKEGFSGGWVWELPPANGEDRHVGPIGKVGDLGAVGDLPLSAEDRDRLQREAAEGDPLAQRLLS